MSTEVIVALFSLFGTLIGSIAGILASNKLTVYRITQLEKKVDEHNSIVSRVAILEGENRRQWERIDEMHDDIKTIRDKVINHD